MTSEAATVDQYINELPEDRLDPIQKLRQTISTNLPEGFTQGIIYGMIGFYLDKKAYEPGYHVGKEWSPLPFINIASQKNFIALYHMGLYAVPELLEWFVEEFPKNSKYKLDMGKSCIRFKKVEHIPLDLIAELSQKITPAQWNKV
jgi:uncharacterized protein YdhG (YjbR/CyaY superfamily)